MRDLEDRHRDRHLRSAIGKSQIRSGLYAPDVIFYAIVKKFNDILRFLTDLEYRQIPNL
ncbi:hypothetical protein [Chamaesiphon sp. VAR_48_metabat_403]|uniref:hypothetical protein n=1 Tax=Chamaesiphon sp. VAR_48_metabat_403 TaxID=2964700 RepID=UPI00286DBEA7|nr:hypothetical protein [Chamaesiphon sp. VAR_48_metabat_403]